MRAGIQGLSEGQANNGQRTFQRIATGNETNHPQVVVYFTRESGPHAGNRGHSQKR